jgi:hypothetical protein
MTTSSRVALPFVGRFIERLNLRYPALFVLLAALTAVDFAVPDLVPLVDELGLLLLTLLVGRWKNRRDGTPVGSEASHGSKTHATRR